jgi:hypothetical protein
MRIGARRTVERGRTAKSAGVAKIVAPGSAGVAKIVVPGSGGVGSIVGRKRTRMIDYDSGRRL